MDERETAVLFAAVGDPTRLALLRFLLREEHCVSQCTEYIGLTQGAASKQLALLAHVGLLARRQVGRRAYYRASDPEAVEGILAAAQAVLLGRQQDRSRSSSPDSGLTEGARAPLGVGKSVRPTCPGREARCPGHQAPAVTAAASRRQAQARD